MEQDLESLTVRRKRLRYRCTHCGMKEMDLILGGFASAHLDALLEAEIAEFEVLVEVPDDLLFLWFSGRETVPERYAGGIYRRIAAHAARGGAARCRP
ncbi:MAG: succinate dehydrogenase assembly factor 2 [Alphaproteobacteria bacterium]